MERLPEHARIGDLHLDRWTPNDVDVLAAAIAENLEHLRPRMAWIAHEPLPREARVRLEEQWDEAWAAGGDCVYAIRIDGAVVGSAGLHRRLGPGGLEIGYWVGHRHEGRGIATAASRALTDLAFTVADIDRVEIHHDVTNLASRRVPEKLGFTRLPDIPGAARAQAPADCGTDAVWQVTRSAWAELGAVART